MECQFQMVILRPKRRRLSEKSRNYVKYNLVWFWKIMVWERFVLSADIKRKVRSEL